MAGSAQTLSDLDSAATVVFSGPHRPRRRIVLDKPRALAIGTLAYGATAWGASLMFRFVEGSAGPSDQRAEQLMAVVGGILSACWLVSVFLILRRRRAG